MSRTTIVLPIWIAREIADAAKAINESGAVLIAGIARHKDHLRLLCREVHWVPTGAYERRTATSLSIQSSGYVHALRRAEELGAIPIWLHTHPGDHALTRRSEHDIAVDEELSETFRIRSGVEVYASMVASPAKRWFRFSGRVVDGGNSESISRLFVVGPRWALIAADDTETKMQLPSLFDRQVRAFGGDVQRVLSQLRVGIVGCGGTGSAIAEQLTRLGIRDVLLVDPDRLVDSNVSRVYGSTPADVGSPKVSVLAAHLRRVAPDAVVRTIADTITKERVARDLTSCDILFGCTDDNAGRLILSRLSAYYLAPVIDLGVLLSSSDGKLTGIDGRITVLTPGEACLVCRDRIDLERARAEQLGPSERKALQREGYAPELGQIEPAVVPYTSAVASFAVAELLERFIGYGPDPEPSEILLRCHDREISTNQRDPKSRHYCDPAAAVLGSGDRAPFMEQTWRVA